MKFTTAAISIIFGLAAATLAAPAAETREFMPTVTYIGIDSSNQLSQTVNIQELFTVDTDMIVYEITSPGGAICNFFGADGNTTTLIGETPAFVCPPQALKSGICDFD